MKIETKVNRLKQSITTTSNTIEKLKKKKKLKDWEKSLLKNSEKKIEGRREELSNLESSPAYEPRKWKKAKNNYGYGDYHTYIVSPEWLYRKQEYYKSHKKECRTCGSLDRQIHLHHRTYARVYKEDDADLVPLCSECHSSLHYLQSRFSLSVEDATLLWVRGTNGELKKKNREALREADFKHFQFLANENFKAEEKADLLLDKYLHRIRIGSHKAQHLTSKEQKSFEVVIARSKITGSTLSYDRQIDKLINRLEKGKNNKPRSKSS